MSRILFAGDPHGNFKPIITAARKTPPAAFILLGDYDLNQPLHEELKDVLKAKIPVWWIHGNHEADREEWHDNLFASDLAANNLNGRVVEIAGLRIAGLGGVFDPDIWHPDLNEGRPRFPTAADYADYVHLAAPHRFEFPSRNGIPLKARAAIYWSDYEALWDQKADILVLHEAPECHRNGFRALGELAESMQVKLVVHGHHHESYTGETSAGIPVIGVDRETVISLPPNL